jgi:hypothetical protein
MNANAHAISSSLLYALAAMFTTACSYHFLVVAEDLNPVAPSFAVQPMRSLSSSRQPEIVEITVYDTSIPSGSPSMIWGVSSERGVPLTQIVYGETPEGFSVLMAPRPLEAGVTYDLSVLAPGGGGGLRFEVVQLDAEAPADDT